MTAKLPPEVEAAIEEAKANARALATDFAIRLPDGMAAAEANAYFAHGEQATRAWTAITAACEKAYAAGQAHGRDVARRTLIVGCVLQDQDACAVTSGMHRLKEWAEAQQ